jgi:hypothetical protein
VGLGIGGCGRGRSGRRLGEGRGGVSFLGFVVVLSLDEKETESDSKVLLIHSLQSRSSWTAEFVAKEERGLVILLYVCIRQRRQQLWSLVIKQLRHGEETM